MAETFTLRIETINGERQLALRENFSWSEVLEVLKSLSDDFNQPAATAPQIKIVVNRTDWPGIQVLVAVASGFYGNVR